MSPTPLGYDAEPVDDGAWRRLLNLPEKIGADVAGFGGFLRCETCRTEKLLGDGDTGRYIASGWPVCCGHTMTWWTQRQIAAGEVPA